MTQEEKAKRYDEALREAKDCHIDGLALSQPVKDVLEHIFPELKESEDEKIKKFIIKTINQVPNDSLLWETISKSSVLDYLEKQDEQKLDGAFVNVDEVREGFMDTVYSVLADDPTNDRANDIINAFDSLPTIKVKYS